MMTLIYGDIMPYL